MYTFSQMWGETGGAHGYLVSLFAFCSNCFASVTVGNQTGIYVWFYSICISVRSMSWRQTRDRLPLLEFWFYSVGLGYVIWIFEPLFPIWKLGIIDVHMGRLWEPDESACKAIGAAPATEQTLSECCCNCIIRSNKPCPPPQCSSWVLPSNLLYIL